MDRDNPNSAASDTTTASLMINRRIAASPERVFDAWLNSKQMETWMAPGHMNATAIVSTQPIERGRFRIDIVGPDKQLYRHTGSYLEIDRPRRLVFTWVSEGVGHHETIVQVDLARLEDNGTEMRLTHTGLPTEEHAEEHERGWGELFDQLDRLLTRS